MNTSFYAASTIDVALAAVLLALFLSAARIAREPAGIPAWGWSHLAWTVGIALVGSGAARLAEGRESELMERAAAAGALLACAGLAGLAAAMTMLADQRRLRLVEKLAFGAMVAVGAAGAAWFLHADAPRYDHLEAVVSACQTAALVMVAARMRPLSRVPYRLPARLAQMACAVLVLFRALDLVRYGVREGLGHDLPDLGGPGALQADGSLWLLLNLCMLMIVSFRAVDTWRQAAHVDPLTGLFNRRGMQRALRKRLAGREKEPCLAVLSVALDHFTALAGSYGQRRADATLHELAAVIERTVRGTDLPMRLQGEVFAIVLVDAPLHVARDLAERLRRRVQEMIVDELPPDVQFTASVGIATGLPREVPVSRLLAQADRARLAAQVDGRDRVRVHEASLEDRRTAAGDAPPG